jgi:phage shock protein PspC (stress-responsive transcriptional regulator)
VGLGFHTYGVLCYCVCRLICKILTMIPLAGTEFVVYFILFFLLDKSDEYPCPPRTFEMRNV